jgi:hypothetical protein
MTDLEQVAKRLFWWKEPAEALADPNRFLAQVMTYGTIQDLIVVERYFPDSALRDVLSNPPAGVFDGRSWSYWHVRFGLTPPPELPMRQFLDEDEQLENDPDFLQMIAESRKDIREGKGTRLEDIED